MHLNGLGADICSTPAGAGFQYCQEKAAAASLQQGSRNAGRMTNTECMAAGGVPVNCVSPSPGSPGFGNKYCDCLIAAPTATRPAPAPAPANITVSPVITSTVSPQISPVFQQQYQPQNSPATAGTSQTTSAPTVPAGPIGVNTTSMAPSPAPAPYLLPSAPAPVPAQSYSIPESPAQDQFPAQTTTPTLNLPQTQPQTGFDWKMAAIIGASIFGAIALTGKRK